MRIDPNTNELRLVFLLSYLESIRLEELNTPSQHISFAPFVLILDENIAEAKEEFKEFLFARFSGDVSNVRTREVILSRPTWMIAGSSAHHYNRPGQTSRVPYVLFSRERVSVDRA
ncbi:hypothetical protein IGI04_019307 [Brassica rapa subsp. trilocularis]|uniref:Uncharacterized protein n=1 Tax=Brassica rapa subsp. trilocularis TaxID=1813537 RepID=A0ABQ7MFG5_BRACM|nr:hypothetical protein IGI04_019307 [Brassica rapa subsp. trilocularis]